MWQTMAGVVDPCEVPQAYSCCHWPQCQVPQLPLNASHMVVEHVFFLFSPTSDVWSFHRGMYTPQCEAGHTWQPMWHSGGN